MLAVVFLKGFLEAIGLAAAVAIPYLFLNLVVLVRGLIEIVRLPGKLDSWSAALLARGDSACWVLDGVQFCTVLFRG